MNNKINDNTISARGSCLTTGSAGGRNTIRSSSFTGGSAGSRAFLFCKKKNNYTKLCTFYLCIMVMEKYILCC